MQKLTDSEGNFIPKWIVEKSIDVILDMLSFRQYCEIREAIAKDPDAWFVSKHFRWGVFVRNLLRRHCCPDDQLPSGNWDDVYTQVIKEAMSRADMDLNTNNYR